MTRQTGYALILMVVALMGIGGVVITGFTQGAKQETEHQRYLHNQRVLKEAKQALLQYAYNYPVTAGNGPGRMPCPDTDNDGIPNATANCSGLGGIGILGRFPWRETEMHFYDARDASGARLWYGVSNQFANSGGGVTVNSDTVGSITIEDRSGALLYDGSVNGVAAVIIAPGAPIDRNGVVQDRSIANGNNPFDTNPDDDPGIIDADKYLDLFGAVDNADFVNGTTDGFVTGPIDNRVSGVLQVNDQMIVITAAEVIAMAEKATLQAYRTSINDYLDNVACSGEIPDGTGTNETICLVNGGVWNPVYPWLYTYKDVTNIADLSSFYPAFVNFDDEEDPDLDPDTVDGYLDNYGRIPSIFANYFTETDSQPIESILSGSLSITFPLDGLTYTQLTKEHDNPVADVQAPAQFNFNDYPTLPFQTSTISDINFVNLANAGEGQLAADFANAEPPITLEMYFWDEDGPTGIWKPCGDDGDNIPELSDCSRADYATPTPGVPHQIKMSILHVVVTLDFPATPGVVNYDMNYSPPPTILRVAATSNSHARIMATFDGGDIINATLPTVSAGTYEYDPHYHVGYTTMGAQNDGAFRAGSVVTADFIVDELTLEMRYYPELPGWAHEDENGWHNSIRMAYADTYLPPLATACVPLPDADPDNDCLFLPDERGTPRNIASLLVIAGEHDWVDDDCAVACDGLADELRDVFDDGNQNNNRSFSSVRGNDKILVIDEL